MEYWSAIVFGWPSALCGIALLILGIAWRNAWVAWVGAAVSAGFCAYVAMNPPPFRVIGLVALACNGLCAVAVARRAVLPAVALLLPFVLAICLLFYASS